jgi:uncharacterized protein
MFKRTISTHIREVSAKYKAIGLLGPRQSGKTTLAKMLFPKHEYYSLEDLDLRQRATSDPRGFLKSIKKSVILDEIQRAPDLLSYIQGVLDDKNDSRQFILTGSNSLSLMDIISQSLAGRIRLLNVLPLSPLELGIKICPRSIDELMWKGLYPRIYDENLEPNSWYSDYYSTYIEKDVRTLLNVENLEMFDRFVRLVAGRVGQLVSYSGLSSEVGVSQPTIKKWVSVLKASYIVETLSPHFKNFSKRIVKSPKIYFNDTGLLCYLLRIENPLQLESHPMRGLIFENWVFNQHQKKFYNQGKELPLYFWRDQNGHEVDLVIDKGTFLELIEVKSSATFHESFLDNIKWLGELQKNEGGKVIYAGDDSFTFKEMFEITSWKELAFGS